MARKSTSKSFAKQPAVGLSSVVSPAQGTEAVETPIATTSVRKTVAPRAASPAKLAALPPAHDRIAERAYYISQSAECRSQDDNWFRAEAELKGEGV